MTTEEHKTIALEAISDLFSDISADEETQIEALEEIASLCEDNITALKEQIRSRAE